MTQKNNSKKYILGLLVAWLLGCIFQFFYCCKPKLSKALVATPVPAVADKTIVDTDKVNADNAANTDSTDKVDADKVVDTDTVVAADSTDNDSTDNATDSDNTAIEVTETTETVAEPAPEPTENAFKLSGNDHDIEFSSEDNFNFLTDTAIPVLPASEGLQNNSKQLADYLAKSKDTRLTVTGLYRSDEKNTSTFDNLGLARADQIKEYLVSQGANAEQIDTDGQVDDQAIADTDGKYLGRADFTLVKLPNTDSDNAGLKDPQDIDLVATYKFELRNPFKVSDGSQTADAISSVIELGSEDNFNFLANQEMPVTPMSEGLQNNSKQLVDYLASNKYRRLTVTGLYRADEENTSIFPNLGLARANQIKEYLVSQGANAQQIDIAGQLDEDVADKDDKYLGRANFSVVNTDDTEQQKHDAEMKQLAEKIHANPVTVYFATGNSNVSLTTEQREIIFDMIRYLDFDADAKVSVTGHTDNVGKAAANTRLGQKRATVVAGYLVSKGLKKERMNVSSEGPNQPIADNATAEGRAKNRRVTISLTNKK